MFNFLEINGKVFGPFETRDKAQAFAKFNRLHGIASYIIPESECERCKWDNHIAHDSCLYGGNAIGHSRSHCTADACF